MAPQTYYRRWTVYLRGDRIGEVLAATEKAACLRAIRRFRISSEDRRELRVRTAPATDHSADDRQAGERGDLGPLLTRTAKAILCFK
jgi:hypothetical protein